jgi:hypothetical protein
MSPNKSERLATLELSTGCLQEAVERLERLCALLQSSEHETECTETANYVSSRVLVIRQEIASLRTEL